MFLLVLFSFCLRSLSPLHTSNRGVTHSHQKSFIFLSTVARSVSPVEPSISLWVQHQLLTGLVLSKPLLSCHPGTPALLLSWARSLFPGLHVCLSYGLRPHFANVCYLIASSEKAQTNFLIHYVAERWASLVAQMVNKKKKPPCSVGDWVWSLDLKDPLEKRMATHSSILGLRIPWIEETGWL